MFEVEKALHLCITWFHGCFDATVDLIAHALE
jgi:hypothetical protein